MTTTKYIIDTKFYTISNFANDFDLEVFANTYLCEDGKSTVTRFDLNESYDLLICNPLTKHVTCLNFNDCKSIEDCVDKLQALSNKKLSCKLTDDIGLGTTIICFISDREVYTCNEFKVNTNYTLNDLGVVAVRCGYDYNKIKDISDLDELIKEVEPTLIKYLANKLKIRGLESAIVGKLSFLHDC